MNNYRKLLASINFYSLFSLLFAGIFITAYAGDIPDSHHASAGTMSGKVIQTMDVAGYTYVEVNLGDKNVWAAGPITSLKTGESVSFSTAMPMKNFHSKTIKRDFEIVYFTGKFNFGPVSPAEHPAVMPSPHAQLNTNTATAPLMGINKVKNGYSIAEILADKNKLKGKTFQVRGKVTKVTNNVMGNNWLHIRDSSTTDDLTVTTKDNAVIDDVIIAKGTVALDQDFSYGYVYPVILIDAKITKE